MGGDGYGGVGGGCGLDDEMVVEPLRVVWSEEEAGSSAQSLGLVGVVKGDDLSLVLERNDPLEGGIDEGDVSTDPWLNGKFAHFLRCLGMLTEGLKEDILSLMRKMKEKMDQASKGNFESRQGQRPSLFDRELKRLALSMNKKRSGKERGGNRTKL